MGDRGRDARLRWRIPRGCFLGVRLLIFVYGLIPFSGLTCRSVSVLFGSFYYIVLVCIDADGLGRTPQRQRQRKRPPPMHRRLRQRITGLLDVLMGIVLRVGEVQGRGVRRGELARRIRRRLLLRLGGMGLGMRMRRRNSLLRG